MSVNRSAIGLSLLALALVAGCAAPAPTATPTTPAAAPTKAAPTPTKAPAATPTKRPVVKAVWVGADFTTTQLALWVARGKGYFLEEGLDMDWVLTGSGAKAVAAVLGGDATVGSAASADVVTAVAQKQPLQAFAAWYIGEIRELVMRKDVAAAKGVTPKSSLQDKLQALRGLTIGATSPGSGTDYAVRFLLTQYGLDPERDVQITYTGSAKNVYAALQQGAIEVGSVSDEGAAAEYEGFGVILISFTRGDIPVTKDKLGTLGIARKDRFEPDREALEAFTRALWKAQRLMRERPDEAREAAFTSTFAQTEPAVFRIKFEQVLSTIPPSPEITAQQLKVTVDFRNQTTTEPPVSVAYEDYYYPKIVEAAKKQLGY